MAAQQLLLRQILPSHVGPSTMVVAVLKRTNAVALRRYTMIMAPVAIPHGCSRGKMLLSPHRYITGRLSSAPSAASFAAPAASDVIIYEAPLAKAISNLKRVSITSCSLTVVFLPLSVFVGNPALPLSGKLVVSGTVCAFAMLTTVVLNLFTKVYLCQLSCSEAEARCFENNDSPASTSSLTSHEASSTLVSEIEAISDIADVTLHATTINVLGRNQVHSFLASQITYPKDESVMVSFIANKKKYFIHSELISQDPRLCWIFRGLFEQRTK